MRHPVLLCPLLPHLMRHLALFDHYPRISCGTLSLFVHYLPHLMRHPVLLCLLPPHLMRVSLALFVHYPRISCGYLSPSLFITSDIPCGHHFDTILCHFLFLLTLKCKKSVKTLPFHLFYLHSPKIFRIFAP